MTAIWVILAILMIGIMILVHELGHFAVGRLCGIGVEEFSIGFGPKLLGWRRKEIDYSLRAIPLGGYVRFTGEDEDSHKPNAFNNHPVWKRFLTVAAGASMNFVLAFAAILLLFMLYGGVLSNLPELYSVEPGSPAELAGLLPGGLLRGIRRLPLLHGLGLRIARHQGRIQLRRRGHLARHLLLGISIAALHPLTRHGHLSPLGLHRLLGRIALLIFKRLIRPLRRLHNFLQ